ncbi:prepilin peptidase [Neisseria canis]|uniref:Prepilin leader peptidase/N-methyltransferase n=1 Tax=Neisseria canis TaxID=493 RepID=A0A3S4QTR7_9NEIS|nr:A24 family peptidase [Neisseria canis]VEF00681.1 protein PilD [Neisseria canis]
MLWANMVAEIYAPFVVPIAVVFGLLVGSFLNVVIYRLPVMMEKQWTLFAKEHLNIGLTADEQKPFTLAHPPSRCPKCGAGVKAWQNIPILSYLLLKGRCGSCHTRISLRYPLVELLTGILFGVMAYQYGWTWLTLGGLVFTAILIALTFIDADTQYLPDSLTLPLIWLGLIYNLQGDFVPLQQAVLGAVVGYIGLWLLNYLFKKIRGIDGMGGGDFKLFAALGAWLGISTLPAIIFVAALVGLVAAIVMRVANTQQQIAFGPSLAIAGWLAFVANEPLRKGIAWWLNSSGLI